MEKDSDTSNSHSRGTCNRGRGRSGHRDRGGRQSGSQPRKDFTHFFAFTMYKYAQAFGQVQDQFKAFVLANYPQHAKDYSFQSWRCQHLTILMLYLYTEDEKKLASAAINNAEAEIRQIAGGPIKIRLTTIVSFDDQLDKRVFFLAVDPTYGDYHKFIQLEDCLIRHAQSLGLAPKQQGGKENLMVFNDHTGNPGLYYTKPHATFMRVTGTKDEKNLKRYIMPKIVQDFNDKMLTDGFGDVMLDTVDICIRRDHNADGHYNHMNRMLLN